MSHSIEQIIHSIDGLRPMPGNVTRLLKEIDNPNVSISNLAGLVSLDQALTAQVLQASNSASLGYAGTCSTLYDAIMHIGLGRLKSTIFTSNVADMMKRHLTGYKLGDGELWHHSLVTAVASEWLAQTLRYSNSEEAYIAGLLHDIGKLFLDQFVLREYSKIVEYMEHHDLQLWQMEEKLIGIDHARVGGLMAEHWNFPVPLVDAIRFHHMPSFARINQRLPALVNLANYFAGDFQASGAGLFSFQMHPETLNILKIDTLQVEQLREKLGASGLFPEPSRNGKVQ
jgi:putative nucleotidyltransferase with HDIG domain